MKFKYVLLIFFLFAFFQFSLFAQKEANIWYFGYQAGLDFNSGAPVALTNGQLSTVEGSASIADANGNLLFYTDGINVWNSTHVVMPNGTGLTGNVSSTQSALIVQQPGSPNLYYIFVFDVDFRYSIVDMTLNSGLGDITSKNVLISNAGGEKQCGAYHANGNDIWVLNHENGTNSFNAFLLSNGGLNLVPVQTSIGVVHSGPYGQMKFSPDGSKVAVGIANTGIPVELFDFDISTGIVSNAISLPATYPQTYGLEFSPDNSKLYTSANGVANEVYQYDLSSGVAATIIASATLVGNSGANIPAGMQLGPDGKIYISVPNNLALDVINNPNDTGLSCNYSNASVNLGTGVCGLGLPAIMAGYFNYLGIIKACQGDSVYFNSGLTTGLGGSAWDFNDPASGVNNLSYVFNPVHYFSTSGTYTVQLIKYFLSGTIDTVYVLVIINPHPSFSLGNDTSICSGTSILLNTGGGFSSYLWQDGSVDSTFLASDSGTYVVTVSQSGCSSTDTLIVSYVPCTFPVVSLAASDTSFCGKQCIDFYDLSTNSPTSWQWFFPGADSTSSNLQNPTNICYNSYGSFDVTLIACNAVGCDTLSIPNFINEFPNPPTPVISSNFDTLFCSTSYSYQWYNAAGSIPGATDSFYVYQQQGLYYVIVTDSNGCAASSSVLYTGLEELEMGGIISLQPNPSNGPFTLNILVPSDKNGVLKIYDLQGRCIYKQHLEKNQQKLSFELNNGLYIVELNLSNKISRQRVVIQK